MFNNDSFHILRKVENSTQVPIYVGITKNSYLSTSPKFSEEVLNTLFDLPKQNETLSKLIESKILTKDNCLRLGLIDTIYLHKPIIEWPSLDQQKLAIALSIESKETSHCYLPIVLDEIDKNVEILAAFIALIKKLAHAMKHSMILFYDKENPDLKKLYDIINSDLQNIVTEKYTENSFKGILDYHYITHSHSSSSEYYVAKINSKVATAIIVDSPLFELGHEYCKTNEYLNYLYKDIITIKRIVTIPQYRGLGVTKTVLERIKSDFQNKIIECRSSLLSESVIINKWHGTIVERPYRTEIPNYIKLLDFLESCGKNFKNGDVSADSINDLDPNKIALLRSLVLARLNEIDTHLWLYLNTLLPHEALGISKIVQEDASKLYFDFFHSSYQNTPTATLLNLCKNWNSVAFTIQKQNFVNQRLARNITL